MGCTVALVGPDGAGKTTVCRELAVALNVPTQYVYMGINLEVSNVLLPTTRLWLEIKRLRGKRSDMGCGTGRSNASNQSFVRRWISYGKSSVRLVNLMGEELFRQLVCRYWRMRGRTVLCDRDFFCDYYAYDVSPQEDERGLMQRLHGWMLKHAYRRPDVLIVLEAPAEKMHLRKSEGTIEGLERRRLEYRDLKSQFRHFYVVDSALPLDVVVQQTRAIIECFTVVNPTIAGGANL